MPIQLWAALIGAAGALAGVATGTFLTGWYQRQAWMRDQAAKSRAERYRVFADFLNAAREWRATTQHSDTKLVNGSAVSKSKHADGGAAAVRTLALRTEISLLGQPSVIRAARELTRSHIRLAEGRAFYRAGFLPDAMVADCRQAENTFIHAARAELEVAGPEAELDDAFRHIDSDPVEPPR